MNEHPLMRVTAALDAAANRVTFYVGGVTAAPQSRTLSGEVVAYGGPADEENPDGVNVGMTSVGPLRVAARGQLVDTVAGPVRADGLSWAEDIATLKLTEEHDGGKVRGYAVALVDSADRLRASFKATSDADGDAAIAEALDHKRDGFSLQTERTLIMPAADGGVPWILSADLVAVGQVGLPAFYKGSRIDSVAASATSTQGDVVLTAEQRARLAELLAMNNRTAEEETEFSTLSALALQEASQPDDAPAEDAPADAPAEAAAAPTAVAASLVPGGTPRPRRSPSTTNETPLDVFCRNMWNALRGDGAALRDLRVSAALTDITHTAHAPNIGQPAWSDELWTGVQHEQEFVPLLNSGTLTSRKGQGWRWLDKPEMADYAGDKAAIPSDTLDTELAEYTAARMAVGHDIDRAYYDFPDGAPFIRSYVELVRESWSIKLDGKAEAYIGANATDSTVDVSIATSGSLPAAVLKAVGLLRRKVKRAKLGKATFVIMGDDMFDSLLDMTNLDVPAFLDLFGIAPDNFTSSALAAFDDKVVVGTKMAATVRTLPGSPIRASAQDIVKGGIDEAFFGYWAIEQHSAAGIQFADIVA